MIQINGFLYVVLVVSKVTVLVSKQELLGPQHSEQTVLQSHDLFRLLSEKGQEVRLATRHYETRHMKKKVPNLPRNMRSFSKGRRCTVQKLSFRVGKV